ncbi:MAG: FAD-dependent oxidoreductase, partial [Leptolyngbyaceae cyanobacterium bins.302]|nr:FAD-dependent oxidoreductase [Leptolyngbyaceae cyanobacterium bins.302]
MTIFRLLPFALPASVMLLAIAPTTPVQSQILEPQQSIDCEILVVGGGFAGTAAAYEGLMDGRTVCLTEITDWVGGQVSSQGTSALDEAKYMRDRRFFPRGYNELRRQLYDKYGSLSSGDCWVSISCFMPRDGHELLWKQLKYAEQKGKGKLKWFPNTVIKDLRYSSDGKQITSAIAIQHSPAPGTPPLNTEPLSRILADAYRPQNSPRLKKTLLRFAPPPPHPPRPQTPPPPPPGGPGAP